MRTVKEPMSGKDYEKALRELQVDLCALQEWVKHKGLRVVVVFEGRDAAGKGGTIKAIHRAGEPARLPGGSAARTIRPREVPALPTALRAASAGRR